MYGMYDFRPMCSLRKMANYRTGQEKSPFAYAQMEQESKSPIAQAHFEWEN